MSACVKLCYDWINRNDARNAKALKSASKRLKDMRLIRDLYHPLMRPEDIPFHNIIIARYLEIYYSLCDTANVNKIWIFLSFFYLSQRMTLIFSLT